MRMGADRDALISESRAVLNLHYYDSQIFQQIRAFYPLTNRIPIISENYPIKSAPDIYKDAIFLNGGESIEKCALRMLSSINFEAQAKIKLDQFKETELENQFSELIESSIEWLNKN